MDTVTGLKKVHFGKRTTSKYKDLTLHIELMSLKISQT
jgi:hypothetical protein